MATELFALRVAALTLALMLPCAQAALVGAVMVQGDGVVTLHVRDALRPKQWVAVQIMGKDDKLKCCTRIPAHRFVLLADANENNPELVSGQATKTYQYTPPKSNWDGLPYAGMAVVFDSAISPAGSTTSSTLSAKVDGKPFSATMCTSSEGIHVLQGPKARPVQEIYIALPYTLESPTCP